jgi:hypothetical protein
MTISPTAIVLWLALLTLIILLALIVPGFDL